MISRLFICCSAFIALTVFARAGTTGEKKDAVTRLSPFVVTAKSRGIVPLNGWLYWNTFTGKITSSVIVSAAMNPEKTLGDYDVKKGEQVIAIDGQRIVGMSVSSLRQFWMETGEAGELVKLTIRGMDENSSVFREITVKRIAPPKRPVPS